MTVIIPSTYVAKTIAVTVYYLDLLKGSPKNKKYSREIPPNGGFPIGKINNHLKQNPDYSILYAAIMLGHLGMIPYISKHI